MRDALHAGLADALSEAGVAQLYACGPHMKKLCDAAGSAIDVFHTETSEGLVAPLLAQLRAGDAVMVKGSLGSKMAVIVAALSELNGDGRDLPERGRA